MSEKHKTRKILIVDDEKTNIITLTQILGGEYTIYAAKSGTDAIEATKRFLPDVILLDIIMPGLDGYEVLSILKDDPITKDIPIIFVTGLGDTDYEEKGLTLGAADYIGKPFNKAIVRLRVRNQIQIIEQMEIIRRLSVTDHLTGLANRRDFDRRFLIEWNHAVRNRTPLSVLMIDIDDFKLYNDKYGHLQGDAALIEVARIINDVLNRSIDFAARWGGEEFIVLLPFTDISGAVLVAEQIRADVSEIILPTALGETTRITVSIGAISSNPEADDDKSILLEKADAAMYDAKQSGKNRIIISM